MSWAYHVAGDAAMMLRRLEIPLQEAIYDELDELAEDADSQFSVEPVQHLFTIIFGGEVHALLLTLRFSSEVQVVTLLGIDYESPTAQG